MKNSFNSQSGIKALKADFVAFRAKCRPHARIPEHLRQAILNAIDSGIVPSLLKTEFGVTSGQVAVWRRRRPRQTQDRPRVLEVIPSMPAAAPTGLRVSYEAGRLLLEFSF